MTCNNNAPDPALCPLCGQPNQCRMCSADADGSACWCAKLEVPSELLAQVPAEAKDKCCICRECVMTFLSQKYRTAFVPANQPGDFYFDRNGMMVFTAAYLLRRGTCCDSGCRHCPYRAAKTGPGAV